MGANSRIEWTDDTFNPWLGCAKVSQGCAHCYAERETLRWGNRLWGPAAPRQVTGARYWAAPHKWAVQAAAERRRRRVFCGSMCDVFEDHPQVAEPRRDLWDLIRSTPELDWLLLTKRPENIGRMAPWAKGGWPLNVWLGVSAEDQAAADLRIPELLKWPAAVRFVSAEPLLGPIDLKRWLWTPTGRFRTADEGQRQIELVPSHELSWVIVGGESGPGCRRMDLAWARDLRDQCARAGVSYFFKQTGGYPDKGVDLARQPDDLRIRQLPSPVIGRA